MIDSEESQGDLHILLVEDDDDHARIISRWLAKSGCPNSVSRVADGIDALAFVKQEGKYLDSPRPNIVLLDLKIPRLDGHEVLQFIKNNPKLLDIPVIVLTTSETKKDIERAYRNHANSYLVKPIDSGDFQMLINIFAQYWGRLNRPSLTV